MKRGSIVKETIVVALGGNAIFTDPARKERPKTNLPMSKATCESIARMVKQGYRVVVTHGNGPQVGNILIQNLHSQDLVPAMPLDVCGAKSQGLIGYMIQQSLRNELAKEGLNTPVVTVLTQVIVDENDPAFQNPTKPIGPFYTEEEAKRYAKERGETWKEDSGRGWRKLVPSPLL